MKVSEVRDIIKSQISGKKFYRYCEESDTIIYTFREVDYKIHWERDYYSVDFYSKYIYDFRNYRPVNYRTISNKHSTIKNNNKTVWLTIRKLSERIKEQHLYDDFSRNVKEELLNIVRSYIFETYDIENAKFTYSESMNKYMLYGKMKRNIYGYTINVNFDIGEFSYSVIFKADYPSVYSNKKDKNVQQTHVKKAYITPKKVTNRIRLAKLKNLFK